MKKQIQSLTAQMLLLVAVAMLQSCVGNGDETITLEFGDVRELIVGEWRVKGSETVLTFINDGYYTDSSDGGTRKHTWCLDSSDGSPYVSGIYLDGTYYHIESMGKGYWILVDNNGHKLILNRDGGDGSEDSGSESQPDTGGNGKLVSQIKCYKDGVNQGSILFYYDKNNRVVSVDYGENVDVCGPNGYHLFYNVTGNTMTLSSCVSGTSSNIVAGVDGDGMGKGTLNSMGLLTEETFENLDSELSSGDYSICRYEHNSKGQCTKYSYYENPRSTYSHDCTYTWENDCIVRITGNPGSAGYGNPSYTDMENKANIDLNYLIMDQMYSEDVFGLALCGYISTKQKYLLDGVEWTLDKGYPVKVEYEENYGKRHVYRYEIIYTK